MNPLALEELSPSYIREPRIALSITLDAVTKLAPPARAFQPVLLDVDYASTKPEGVVLPLLLEVQGPSPASYQRREFLHAAPDSLVFEPREGGTHLVTLREVAHNRWWGSLRVEVEGERLDSAKAV